MATNVEFIAGEHVRAAGGLSFPLIIPVIFVFVTLTLLHVYLQSRRIAKMGNRIPGPATLPLIGNAHMVWNKTHNGRQSKVRRLGEQLLIFSHLLGFSAPRNPRIGHGAE